MAVDKLVDSTQLDAGLTSVANAIRTKGGTSGQLTFPAGFVQAIDDIPTGGGGSDISPVEFAKFMRGDPSNIDFTNLRSVRRYGFGAAETGNLYLPYITTLVQYVFDGVNAPIIVLPAIIQIQTNTFRNCNKTEVFDLGSDLVNITAYCFQSDTVLNTVILRGSTNIVPMLNTSAINNTPFASGGAGGTIYIPKALYDHLGDGTALDYKAATNWSTVDGYGTITWAQIEGSQYENYYADGTPIT